MYFSISKLDGCFEMLYVVNDHATMPVSDNVSIALPNSFKIPPHKLSKF